MINPDHDELIRLAKRVRPGQSERVPHCGSRESCILYSSEDTWSYYCFKCGLRGYQRKEIITPVPKFKYRTVQMSEHTKESNVFLGKFGIQRAFRDRFFGWSNDYKGLFIPFFHNDCKTNGYQVRPLNQPNLPKYIQSRGDKSVYSEYIGDKPVVLTEDCLSAVKVHQSTGLHTMALLGTKLRQEHTNRLCDIGSDVIVWLDSDEAGRVGAKKVIESLDNLLIRTGEVITGPDPKCIFNKDIRSLIQNVKFN